MAPVRTSYTRETQWVVFLCSVLTSTRRQFWQPYLPAFWQCVLSGAQFAQINWGPPCCVDLLKRKGRIGIL